MDTKKRLEYLTFAMQMTIFILAILFWGRFDTLYSNYFLDSLNEAYFYPVLVLFGLLYCYRIILSFSFIGYCWCCCCCISAIVNGGKCDFSNVKQILKLFWKFISGSLDFLSIFTCISNLTKIKIQSVLDVITLVIDCVFLLSSIVLASILASQRVPGGEITMIINYFAFAIPLLVILVVDYFRFRNTREASKTDSYIFKKVDKSHKCTKVLYTSAINSRVCPYDIFCKNTEPEHRVKYHKKSDIFKLLQFNPRGNGNVMLGFHQTSIESAVQIIENDFRPSKEGMLGPGVYFAINFDATEIKARGGKGATFVAQIDLGRVEEIKVKPVTRNIPIQDGYQSKYLHHPGGVVNDEFIVINGSRIIKYVMVADKERIDEYHKNLADKTLA